MYAIEVENLKKLRDLFDRYPAIVDKHLQAATKNAGKIILAIEKKEVPVATGNLRRSIQMDYQPIVAKIYPLPLYAGAVNFGTGLYGENQRLIVPVKAKAMRWTGKGGKVFFAKSIKGQKPNPFVERTVEKSGGEVNRLFDEALTNIINEK